MAWDVIKIVLMVLGGIVGLVLAFMLFLGVASCFNVGVRFSNYGENTLYVKYGVLRFKVLPKKPKPEPSEEEKQKAEEKKKRKTEKRKRRREKWRARYEKWKMRRAVRQEKRKARRAARNKKQKQKFSSSASWLSEPTEGRTRAIVETLFDVLPRGAKLIKFRNIKLSVTVRGDDPAQTGIAYGRIGEIFGLAYPQIMRIFNVGRHNVWVDADFAHRGKTEVKTDLTVLLRPISLVGFLFRLMLAWFRNKDIYCVKPKTTHTTVKMKPDGGNKNG